MKTIEEVMNIVQLNTGRIIVKPFEDEFDANSMFMARNDNDRSFTGKVLKFGEMEHLALAEGVSINYKSAIKVGEYQLVLERDVNFIFEP